jgi:acyl-CoA thioester hydrolase
VTHAPLKGRKSYKVWREIGTRWADNDAYGHVNNTVHYTWFDTAVNSWLIEQDLLDVVAGDPIGLVVETGCRYVRPLCFPQSVDVGLVVEAVGKSSVRYRLGVFAQDQDEASAEGYFVHVYVSRESRRPVPLPAGWLEAFAAIAE